MTSIYSFLNYMKRAHYGRGEYTMAMVGSDAEALGHRGFTMILLSWLRPSSNFDAILEDCYHFIVVVLISMVVVNVPWLWSSVESSNLYKFM